MGLVILSLSLLLQVVAAFFSFRLLRVTRWRYAWGAVTAALLLMAGRRLLTLYHVTLADPPLSLDLSAEVVALLISATMLAGVSLLGPHLRTARETEEALRESERRLRILLNHLPDAVGLMKEGRIAAMNPAFTRILGYDEEEMIGRSPFEFLHPDDRARGREEIEAILAGKAAGPNEYRLQHKDGDYIPVEAWSRVVELDDEPSLLTVFRDVRERKQREEALEESERRFVAFMEHLPAVAFIKDLQGRHVYANDSFENLLGLNDKEWRDRRNEDLFSDEVAERLTEHDAAVLESGDAQSKDEDIHTSDGERVFRTQRFPVFDDEGEVALLGGIARDVTREQRTLERQRRLTTVIEQATELVIITDPDGTIEYVNPAFETITGYSADEAVGRNPRMLQSGEQDEAFYRRMWRSLRSGDPWSSRFVNRRKDGELYHQETTISPVKAPDGEIVAYVGIGHDVTHLVRLEERLRHAERMEAIGTLTGGVAHDFNNILAVVLSNAELALETVPEEHGEAREALTDLKRTAEVGAEVVRKLLVFSRREPMQLEPLDVGAELEEMASTLRRLLPARIDLHVDLDPDLPPVRADRGAIHQILMNLASNARDAIEGEGRFRVTASVTTLTREDTLQFGELEAGEHVVVSVSDTGQGMDEETRDRIFEPFFTTKESGHGTGLGLATVYSLVQQHDGLIQVYSEVGVGTNFRIFFPVTTEQLPKTAEEAPDDPPAVSGTGRTVLLIEDDDALRRVAERMLGRLGFTVLVASDGEEGWQTFQDAEDRLDVVVSDFVLPKLGGVELLARIHEQHPDLPLILSSGYAPGETTESLMPVGEHVAYLQKPWTVRDLAAVIGSALS